MCALRNLDQRVFLLLNDQWKGHLLSILLDNRFAVLLYDAMLSYKSAPERI